MTSVWHKFLSQPGHIRVVAVEATALALELCKAQQLTGPLQSGLSEAVVGALLLASAHKSSESINLNAQGSGLYRQAVIDASPEGRVRGFLREQKDRALQTYGPEGRNGPWGSGVLSILYTKNFEGKSPYTGMVPISTGFLDDAINEYYRDSAQLVSRVGLFVETGSTHVTTARGALVQALGGADQTELDAIAALTVQNLRGLARSAGDEQRFIAEVSALLGGRTFKKVESQPLVSFCTCSQERIERALTLTGEEGIMQALGQDPYLTITCDFCRKEYRLAAERIKSLFSRDPSRLQ